MNTLPKDVFISTIESLQLQVSRDVDASNAISKVFATDAVYDNSLLIMATIKLLQVFFPKDENGFCEIEHYCFDMNFGKIGSDDLITPEDLWDRLDNKEFYDASIMESLESFTDNLNENGISPPKLRGLFGMISTHPLIDDNPNPDGV